MSKPREWFVRMSDVIKVKDFCGPMCKPGEEFMVIEKSAADKLADALDTILADCEYPQTEDVRLKYDVCQIYKVSQKEAWEALKEYRGEK